MKLAGAYINDDTYERLVALATEHKRTLAGECRHLFDRALKGDLMLPKWFAESEGVDLIAKERQRQKDEEGYHEEDDAGYPFGVLEAAAECYLWELRARLVRGEMVMTPPPCWPWPAEAWKPCEDEVRQLEKAGALCAAALDLRLAKKRKGGEGR